MRSITKARPHKSHVVQRLVPDYLVFQSTQPSALGGGRHFWMPRYQNHEKSGQSIPLERIAIFPLDGDQGILLAEVFSAGIAFSSIALITGSSQIRDNRLTSPTVGFDVINDGA